MSTGKVGIQAQRFALLARMDEKIFHADDLANLWLIENKNTLYTTLKRYCGAGLLHRLFRGFYSLPPPDNLDPVLLGAAALHDYCYLSTESVLYREGYISQKPAVITFVSSRAKNFKILNYVYKSRKIKERYLFNSTGIENQHGVRTAGAARAIADLLYFMPKFYFDRPVDWGKIRDIQKKTGYPLTKERYAGAKNK